MQPNFKSLIACSIFPFPSYQHHSSFYTQEHPVKKCSILAPHDVPQFGDNVEMNLGTLDTKSSKSFVSNLVVFHDKVCPHHVDVQTCWHTIKLLGVMMKQRKKRICFFPQVSLFMAGGAHHKLTSSAFADTNFATRFWSHQFRCRRKSPAERKNMMRRKE